MDRLIIGLTGAIGCGTTFLAENFFEKELQFERVSLSKILRIKYKEKYGEEPENRQALQEFGNELRKEDREILARTLDEQIISTKDTISFVIESIRNPAEINYFRNKYPEFILIGIFADYDVR